MSSSYTNIFGGANVDVANPSLTTVALTALTPQVTLSWPIQFQDTNNVTANIIEITADAGGRSIKMPQANQVSVGQALILNNLSAFAVTIYTADGATVLVTIAGVAGGVPSVVEIYLVDNTTKSVPQPTIVIGTWRAIPWGGGAVSVSSISAAPAAGVTAANLSITPTTITTTGTFTFALLGDLLALTSFAAGAGIAARTAANTWALRSITGTANQITVTNGNGVAANPTLSLPTTITGINNLTVGNINITANTISATNANGDVDLTPLGTGAVKSAKNITLLAGSAVKFDNPADDFYTSFAVSGLTANFANTWPTTVPTAGQVISASVVVPGNPNVVTLAWATVATSVGGPTTVNAIARYANVTGGLTNSGVLINNTNDITGANSAVIGNIQIGTVNANTISTSGGILTLQPNGASEVQCENIFNVRNGNVLKISNVGSLQYVGLKAGVLTTSTTYTLPLADGVVGEVPATTGAAVLNFVTIPGRNMVLNGDFQVFQAVGPFSITSATQYGPDRWQILTGAGTAGTFRQQAGATSGSFLCRVQRDAVNAGTNPIVLSSSLPRNFCIGAAGKKVTVSFKAACGVNYSPATTNLNVSVFSGEGTTDISNLTAFPGNSFTNAVQQINSTPSLTTNLINYSFTSATLGAAVSQFEVRFTMTPTGVAGVDDWFQVTDVQLETSNFQTPFERLSFSEVLRRSQEFVWQTFPYGTAPAQNAGVLGSISYTTQIAGVTAGYALPIIFPVSMRAIPTLTFYNPSAANANWRNVNAGADSGAASSDADIGTSRTGFCLFNPQAGGDAVAQSVAIHTRAVAELV